MAAKAMLDLFKSKKASRFGDEGPPDSEDTPRGSGAGAGDDEMSAMGEAPPVEGGGPGAEVDAGEDPEMKAVDDMADILGVGPADREDFAMALKTYVSTCIANTMGEQEPDGDEGGAMPPEGMPSAPAEGV